MGKYGDVLRGISVACLALLRIRAGESERSCGMPTFGRPGEGEFSAHMPEVEDFQVSCSPDPESREGTGWE